MPYTYREAPGAYTMYLWHVLAPGACTWYSSSLPSLQNYYIEWIYVDYYVEYYAEDGNDE